MSTPAVNNAIDPNALFQQLVKEAQAADASQPQDGAGNEPASPNGGGDQPPAATTTLTGLAKVAADLKIEFNAEFFGKLGSNDAEALSTLNSFASGGLEAGHTSEEIESFVSTMESAATAAPAANSDEPAKGDEPAKVDEPADGEPADAFEVAKAEAENAAIEKAIDDELANNPLAKAAGITREIVETYMIGEAEGEAYYLGRQAANELVQKIASQVIPGDEMVDEAVKVLKDAGLDVGTIETEIADLKKEASTQPTETEAGKKAREMAQAEQAMVESFTVLKCAGFDVEGLMKQAEEKKKIGAGKKALIAGGTLAGLAGGGYLAKRHSGTVATKAVGAMNAMKSKMGKG